MPKGHLHTNKRLALSSPKGFSLVEILVAVSVFLVFVLATSGVMGSVFKNTRNSSNRERATILAEEAVDVARNLRDSAYAFANLPNGTYGLSSAGNQWNLVGSSDTQGIFTRSLTISTINASQKKVAINVTWTDQFSSNNSVSMNTYLTDWDAPLSIGLTINKTVINYGGTKVPSDFLPINLTTLAWNNSVDPPVQNLINIPIVFSPSTMTLGPGTYTFSTSNDPGYSLTLSTDCGGGSITLANGDAKLCNITYTQYVAPTVTTPTSTSITATTATLGATVTSLGNPATISARGICYNTAGSPTLTNGATCVTATLSQTTPGVYTVNITGLSSSTTYKFAGYATNATGTGYSADGTFTTANNNVVPTVTTPVSSAIAGTTATLGATVTSLGLPATLTARGICYNTTGSPTLTNGATCVTATLAQTLTAYTVNVTGLVPATTYKFAGYATNATGTGYSADGTFTTIGGSCTIIGTAGSADSSGTVSLTVALPSGASVQQNDILFAYLGHVNATDRLISPTGWTQIGRNSNGTANEALFYRIAGANEPASYTFALSSSSRFGGTISSFRGCFNTVTPIETGGISNTQYTNNDTIVRAASMTLPSPYTTVITFPGVVATGNRTFTAPTTQGGGWTTVFNFNSAASQFSRTAFVKMINSSGATGVIDATVSSAATTNKHAFAVALKPL